MCRVGRSDVERHCQRTHPTLPLRWTSAAAAAAPGDVVDQSTRSTLNVDRLKSGVTLRQTKISDILGGGGAAAALRPSPESSSDSDDASDDSDNSEVGMARILIRTCGGRGDYSPTAVVIGPAGPAMA